ncbi:helix-turn-helix transcriptional regulator [Actinomadura rubrisoli]|uniref:XRE family transcriptional regulator n=1 Tax=Actinomadura rubrisoli TaxID=2530368 RepID=A0A4R5AXV4_9ACTN|nr:helix-turn-helix transcriptional regulator [Actinomadura rubrisoli]TDD77703.1 XRE family transcriptional regulator [Actinomadura rubrisoli]
MPNPERAPARLNHEPDAVRWARKKSGLTQTALAQRAGLSRTLIVEIEAGTRNATDENLIKLARAMNCPVVALERKRVPEATPTADGAVQRVRDGQRTGQHRADQDALPELRGSAVEQSAS